MIYYHGSRPNTRQVKASSNAGTNQGAPCENIGKTPQGTKRVVWKNKWIALVLCVYLGIFGAHKFYEGRKAMGCLYAFTLGLFGLGWFFDIFIIILKPNPYPVEPD